MERFAQAALGKLREPQLPLPPHNASTSHSAAPAVLAIVAATSVLVALSEERDAFLELAATDRRTAMKNSWEGLAKDILRADNIEIARLDPDAPGIGRTMDRLRHSLKYPPELVDELTNLQATARTLFNQSSWAYEPSAADARQYILRCEQARRKLRQTE
jgi:hypothetical protein